MNASFLVKTASQFDDSIIFASFPGAAIEEPRRGHCGAGIAGIAHTIGIEVRLFRVGYRWAEIGKI